MAPVTGNNTNPMDRLRTDKWLWAARFFKTRSLASEEIKKGRVRINGVAIKPAHEVKSGDTVQLHCAGMTRTVVVQAISDKRGPAPVAAVLYEETPASVASRSIAAEQRRLAPEPALSLGHGRPTKRDRRASENLRTNAALDS